MAIITLTTDFGAGNNYTAMMQGVILAINPDVTLVNVTDQIPPQNIKEGAIVLNETTPWFPEGTIHVAVVDPGVGTDRAILYAEIGTQRYVLPDNGLLSYLTKNDKPDRLIRLENREYFMPEVSSTFHGRDIMAPVAAHLSLGVDPARLGPPAEEYVTLEMPKTEITADRIHGVVEHIDSFGNLVTNISTDMLIGRITDERVVVVCGLYETWGIRQTYAEQLEDTFVAIIGSSGRVELAIVGDSAARRLAIPVGTPIVLAWE